MDYQQKGAGNWYANSNLVVSYTIVDGQFQHMYVKKINSFWRFHALKRNIPKEDLFSLHKILLFEFYFLFFNFNIARNNIISVKVAEVL
jgi:hypothetical protein